VQAASTSKEFTYVRERWCHRRQKVREVGPEISWVRTIKRRSFTTEKRMLETAPTTLEQHVPAGVSGAGAVMLTSQFCGDTNHEWASSPMTEMQQESLPERERGKETPQPRQRAKRRQRGASSKGLTERIDVQAGKVTLASRRRNSVRFRVREHCSLTAKRRL
jgi:hypothetical protein